MTVRESPERKCRRDSEARVRVQLARAFRNLAGDVSYFFFLLASARGIKMNRPLVIEAAINYGRAL